MDGFVKLEQRVASYWLINTKQDWEPKYRDNGFQTKFCSYEDQDIRQALDNESKHQINHKGA